ncbi:MAG: hypothetical protein WC728_18255 [Elusimicrobiota bacterium]
MCRAKVLRASCSAVLRMGISTSFFSFASSSSGRGLQRRLARE